MNLSLKIGFYGCLCLALLASPAWARERAYGWCQNGGVTGVLNGLPGFQVTPKIQASYPGCTVTVYVSGSQTLATLYGDNNGTAKSNPFTADNTGYYFFYADNGHYDVSLSGGGLPSALTRGDVFLDDLPGLPNGAAQVNYQLSATGSASRTIAAKLGDIVSVKDFGCAGDGVTDDSTCIQNAVNYEIARVANGAVIGGAVYFPTAQYKILKTINITKSMPGGITLYGDGPHATYILAPITGFTGTSAFNVNSNGGALVFRGMAVIGGTGGVPGVDGIYSTGNGQFFQHLWLGGWGTAGGAAGAGIHLYQATNVVMDDVIAEHNSYGFNFDTSLAYTLGNSQTYQNILAGINTTGQIPLSMIGGTGGQPPASEISNMDLMEDLTGGGGNGAIVLNGNTPLLLSNISIASNNNGSPSTGIFVDSGADRVDISNLHVGHAMNFGIYARGGWVSVNGGVIDRLGSYTSITVPAGGYSSTTQVTGIYATSGVNALLVNGVTFRNLAGSAIISASNLTTINNNIILNFGLGNISGGQQNATTGLTGIALIPSANFAQFTVIGNTVSSSAPAPLTAFSINPTTGVTLLTHAIRAVQNSAVSAFGTPFSTTLTAAQLRTQDLDLDGTTRFAGGHVISTGFASEMDVVGSGGNPSYHLTDALEGNYNDFGFVLQPGAYAQIYAVHQNTAGLPLQIQPPGSGNGNILLGTATDTGVKNQYSGGMQSQGINFTGLGTPPNGTVEWCTDCQGGITGSTPNTCTTGGTGAWAFRSGGAWKCPF